ncbi:hypothetical protein FFLO_00690 [Filobasidium floriforme]|uniref:cellulase n=1 Tax=Filobasidium floriforme TaxID=5210 RepID=A0A8K0JVU7_9TREE|nr:9 glycosyl hydrolase [Filobasidium floriforme]KAG7571338.1 hypothetical protein FFLO_00690 [Filobasidium floriforme]KAH8086289.1 9 glycosyl hydrolase [Filobasidium floriforme]
MLGPFLALCALIDIAFAQLTPSVVYQPPDPSEGAQVTNGTRPNQQYSDLLGNALWFYEAQRSGKLPDSNRVPWRNDSVLNDGSDWGIDLSRGYFDAGDYSINSFNLAGTLFEICWGATMYGAGYDAANQTAYLDQMLRWGLDWAMRAHPQPNTIYAQVGNLSDSGTYWGGDQNIPEPRPAFPINETHPGTDLASAFSSMFSMCSLLYSPGVTLNTTTTAGSPTGMGDAELAAQLRQHAVDSYSFAMNTTMVLYPLSIPEAGAGYNSSSFADDLTLAAISLALLTNNSAYYVEALDHYNTYALSTISGAMNWDGRNPAVFMSLVEAALARPALAQGAGLATNLTGWQTQMEAYLDGILEGKKSRPYFTNGRLLWYEGDSNSASLNVALNAAILFDRYAPYSNVSWKPQQYHDFALTQLDYALGKNPLNAVYVVGTHNNSIHNPHSAPASGGNSLQTLDTYPVTMAHTLYGACVGGPDAEDRYWDLRGNYEQSEVAIDYTAPILTLAAYHVMTSDRDPFYTSLASGSYTPTPGHPCNEDYPCGGDGGGGGLSKGAKIAIGVVVPVVVLAGIFTGVWLWKRRKSRRY